MGFLIIIDKWNSNLVCVFSWKKVSDQVWIRRPDLRSLPKYWEIQYMYWTFDYNLQLLAEAIRSVTEMNPDISVERIECMRQIEEVEDDRKAF